MFLNSLKIMKKFPITEYSDAFTMLLTNESNTNTLNLPLHHVKVKPGLEDVIALNDSNDSTLPTIDLANTSPFTFGSTV